MTKLLWDQTGDRFYETGVDRGVLYLPDRSGVPWNGLTAVDEDTSDVAVEAFYYDGFKYLETRSSGDFSGTLKAFTFPEEFMLFDGLDTINKNGMQLGNQPVTERFGVSYRTRIGNDVDGSDHGYKIHVVYNLTATPEGRSYSTLSEQQNPLEFSWKLTAVPEMLVGQRPTAHVVFDTTRMNPYLISDLEDLLYGVGVINPAVPVDNLDGGTPYLTTSGSFDGGTSTSGGSAGIDGGGVVAVSTVVIDGNVTKLSVEARLPSLAELAEMVETWVLIDIVDNGDGTWTATGPDDFITMTDSTQFQINSFSAVYIDAVTYKLSTTSSL